MTEELRQQRQHACIQVVLDNELAKMMVRLLLALGPPSTNKTIHLEQATNNEDVVAPERQA